MADPILLEGMYYLGLLVYLTLSGVSAVATAGPLFSNYEDWWDKDLKKPYSPPDWVKGIIWVILYACLAGAGFLVWQKPIFIAPITGQLVDLTDAATFQKGFYLTLLSLHFVLMFFPPIWTTLVFKFKLIGLGIWCIIIEICVVGTLAGICFAFYYIPAILYSVYLGYSVIALILNIVIYNNKDNKLLANKYTRVNKGA